MAFKNSFQAFSPCRIGSISPSFSAITEGGFADVTPQSVLFLATSRDANGSAMMAAESLANFTKDPKRVIIFDSAAHGLTMFYKHPEIKHQILAWLRY